MKTSTTYQLEQLVNNITNGQAGGTYEVSINDFGELEFSIVEHQAGYYVSSKFGGYVEPVQASAIEFSYALIRTALNVRHFDYQGKNFRYLGIWTDPETDMVYFDATAHFNSGAVAYLEALENEQLAYFDIAQGVAVNTPHSDYNQP